MAFTILKISLFIILSLLILFGSHYLLYRSFVSFFGIIGSSTKLLLRIILFLLSISFIIASLIAHFRQGLLTKLFYIIAASWWGLLVNLLLAAFLIWLLTWFLTLIGFNPKVPVIGVVIFSLAILFSIYGVWNAFHPQVKNIEVEIKNLPIEWKNKIIVQLSDVHLGQINGPNFLQDVVEKVNALHPDLVVITGDLFDGMDGDLSVFIKPLNDIQAKKGTFFVTGNHETYLGVERTFSLLKETNVKVLNDELFDAEGLQIVGISYPPHNSSSNILGKSKDTSSIIASLKNFNPAKPSILLHHAPTNIDQARNSGINLQLSGHTHKGQIFPIGFISRLIYGKYYYGLYTEGYFTVYTTSGVGAWGPPMRTGNTPEIVAIKIK